MIKKKTMETLPFLGELFHTMEHSWIEDIICDNDSCVISFVPNRNGEKAWLELCRFKGEQHVDFELIEACEGDRKLLDYEVFVSDENKRSVLRKIVSELQKCYAGKERTERIAKRIVASPTIWQKDSKKISLYPEEESSGRHKEPHIHVQYKKEYEGVIRVEDGELLSGSLPERVLNWCENFFLELFRDRILKMLETKVFYRLDRPSEVIKHNSHKKSHNRGIVSIGDPLEWKKTHIKNVEQISSCVLRITFQDGAVKDFNLGEVITRGFYRKMFLPLITHPSLVQNFKMEHCGSGIFWDDTMGFPSDWLYEVSKNVEQI